MIPLRAALLGALGVAAAARAVAPPVVPWAEADQHVGEIVTLEGVVAAARTTGEACILEFAPDDAHAARVVLMVPLFSRLPRAPDRLYVERRIRASGLLRRFQGRPEMVLRSPAQIEVVDVAGPAADAAPPVPAPPAPARPDAALTAPTPPATTPPARAAVATPEVASPPPTEPAPAAEPPRALSEELARRLAAAAPCERAKARWRDAAHRAGDLSARLERCLAGEGYRCRTESGALAPALTEIEWAEQQVEEACP